METLKFVINNIYPSYLKYHTDSNACELVCMVHQDLDDLYAFISTDIHFYRQSKFKDGSMISLIGKDINDVLFNKHTYNSFKCNFDIFDKKDINSNHKYYYTYKGNCLDEEVKILIPRHNFVRIKYLIESIKIYGGFPKSSSFMFSHDKINFIKIDDVDLEGSRISEVFEENGEPFTEIQNVFILKYGGKEYHLKDLMIVNGSYSDSKCLKRRAPDFLFDKVYIYDFAMKMIDEYNNEVMFIVFDKDKQCTNVFSISDENLMYKLSSEYVIKNK